MPATTRYAPKHRAVKNRVLHDWKRLTALGATLPAAFGTAAITSAPADASSSQRQEKIREAVHHARQQKGEEYEYGSNGPNSFDCSGLMQYVFGKAGIELPRTSDAQAEKANRISKSNMEPGDLMVFHEGGDVYHIGIYTGWTQSGKRRLIEAVNEQGDVRSTGAWDDSWYAATLGG